MEIIVGKTAGFCYGVERAVKGATEQMNKSEGSVFCLGEIVHNPQVIKKLEDLGIKCVETIEEAKGTVLIRAHGVPKEVYDIAEELQIKIQDFTCPNVLKVHQIADKFRQEGYFIFLLGTKGHPENVGTLSHCGEDYYIFEKEEELPKAIEEFQKTNKNKLLLISQTTYSLEKFDRIEKKLRSEIEKDVELVVKNTICRTTELRQKETEELSKKVDAMIIIGGKNSSNTKKLYETAKKNCKNTILVENVQACRQELDLAEKIKKVGVMAGASTPKESIEEILEFLKVK